MARRRLRNIQPPDRFDPPLNFSPRLGIRNTITPSISSVFADGQPIILHKRNGLSRQYPAHILNLEGVLRYLIGCVVAISFFFSLHYLHLYHHVFTFPHSFASIPSASCRLQWSSCLSCSLTLAWHFCSCITPQFNLITVCFSLLCYNLGWVLEEFKQKDQSGS